MTLIIGVRCADGVVIGADGAATLGAMGQGTIIQPVSKLETLENKIIFGSSGPIGLGQRFSGEIKNAWLNKDFSNKQPFEVMTIIRSKMWKHVEVEMKAASVAKDTIGGIAITGAICQSVIAMPVKDTHHLFQFDQNCSPEEATDKLPFVSIGSGQPIADPFLAFLKRIFWKDKKPSLVEGILTVLWTLKHAIEINPGGVSEPKQIVILEKKNNDWTVRELTHEELQEHYEFIDGAENALANYAKQTNNDTVEEIKIPEP